MKRIAMALFGVLGLGAGWAFADLSADRLECSRHCYSTRGHVGVRSESSRWWLRSYRLDVAAPVHWELVEQGRGWDKRNARPPLHYELFPQPWRDPRIGTYSRSPITLRYWWE